MAQYTYLFADLLTNEVLGELPLFGTYFEKYVNNTGNANFSFKIGQGGLDDTRLDDKLALQATIPGRTALYVDRDGDLIWGGIVWSRVYQSQAKTVSCTAQTMDSYLFRRVRRANALYVASLNWDQRNIVIDLLQKMVEEGGPQSDLGLLLPDTFSTEVVRTKNVWGYDFNFYGDLIQSIYQLDNGFDFMIDVAYQRSVPRRFVLIGYPNLGDAVDDPNIVTLDYPGPIFNYYWPESVSGGADQAWAVGAGDGASKLFGVATDSASLDAGYPLLEVVNSYTDVTQMSTINAHAAGDLETNKIPSSIPTLNVTPDEMDFNNFQVGTYCRLVIEDDRFPDGFDDTVKINGWTLTPNQSSGSESCTLVVAGSDQ